MSLLNALSDLRKATHNLSLLIIRSENGGYLPLPGECGNCEYDFSYCEVCKGPWCPCGDCMCKNEVIPWRLP